MIFLNIIKFHSKYLNNKHINVELPIAWIYIENLLSSPLLFSFVFFSNFFTPFSISLTISSYF